MGKAKQKADTNVTNPTSDWDNASDREIDAIKAAGARFLDRHERLRVEVKETETGFTTIAAKGGVPETLSLQLADAMGTTSTYFTDSQLGNIATFLDSNNKAGLTGKDVSAALAVLDGMKPENEVEAMLLTQMWATNETAMRCLTMIGKSEWVDNMSMFGNLAVKMMRTYTAQVEALAKLRRKGEQVIKHVHVDNRGGQAVVAETVNTGGQNAKNDEQCHATGGAIAGSASVLGHDAQGNGVPITSREGPEKVPDARRNQPRCPKGQSKRA